MYIARHYVRVNGKMFTPGEVITESISKEKESRLLEKGAISKVEDAPVLRKEVITEGVSKEEDTPDPRESEIDHKEDQEIGNTEENDDEEDATDEAEASDEEAPAIDVTDGIVSDPANEEPDPSTRKRGSKKKTRRTADEGCDP